MKKRGLLIGILLAILLLPQITFAAWWSSTNWFNAIKNILKHKNVTQQATTTDQTISDLSKKIDELEKRLDQKDNVSTSTKPSNSVASVIKKSSSEIINSSNDQGLTNQQIISKVKPAIVYISTTFKLGSGMIISSDGYILTNAHVVSEVNEADVTLSTGEVKIGSVVGRDEKIDLAVVKINKTNSPFVQMGNSDVAVAGDNIFTLGFPFGVQGDVSFKEGTISRRLGNDIEISAEIHPGNSGGPLVNNKGQVIGINTYTIGKTETIKFAIPINVAKALIPDLEAGKQIFNDKSNLTERQLSIVNGLIVNKASIMNSQPISIAMSKAYDSSMFEYLNREIQLNQSDNYVIKTYVTNLVNGYQKCVDGLNALYNFTVGFGAFFSKQTFTGLSDYQISKINDLKSYELQKLREYEQKVSPNQMIISTLNSGTLTTQQLISYQNDLKNLINYLSTERITFSNRIQIAIDAF